MSIFECQTFSMDQRMTSVTLRCGGMVSEPFPEDEEFETYIDCAEYEKSPEY